jgi:hypothetical protein
MAGDRVAAALEEIRAREKSATPGPWGWRGNIDNGDPYLTSRGYREVVKPDGTTVRHHAGDVLGHIPVELTRADAIRRGVGGPDSLTEPKVSREPADTYDERYGAAVEAAREAEIEDWLTDEHENPRTEHRLAFCTDWLYTDARKLVTFEVAPGATDRADPRVYRADITGIRHPDAEFIEHSRQDLSRLLAAVDAALSHHKRDPLYGNAATEGEPGNCPHDPDSPLHFEAGDGSGEWLCEGRPEGTVCGSCTDGPCGDRLEWPCPEYLAILAALTGEGNTDG